MTTVHVHSISACDMLDANKKCIVLGDQGKVVDERYSSGDSISLRNSESLSPLFAIPKWSSPIFIGHLARRARLKKVAEF